MLERNFNNFFLILFLSFSNIPKLHHSNIPISISGIYLVAETLIKIIKL